MKRPLSHLKPRYVWDRLVEKIWYRRHPELPWITPQAVPLLEDLLRPTDRVFEWGSGRSTRWLAARTAAVTSIESDPDWHRRVEDTIHDLPTVRCLLMPLGSPPSAVEIKRYTSALGTVEPGPVDVVLVDGMLRDLCAIRAVEFLSPGGVLVVDDVQRRIPSDSRAPSAVGDFESEAWREFAGLVADWRHIWVGSGVTDTSMWIRPES